MRVGLVKPKSAKVPKTSAKSQRNGHGELQVVLTSVRIASSEIHELTHAAEVKLQGTTREIPGLT